MVNILKLICSYCSVEYILILFEYNKIVYPTIFDKYKIIIPDPEIAAKYGYFEVMKYLFNNNIRPSAYVINLASKYGYLNILQYLFARNITPTYDAINWASENGHLEVV